MQIRLVLGLAVSLGIAYASPVAQKSSDGEDIYFSCDFEEDECGLHDEYGKLTRTHGNINGRNGYSLVTSASAINEDENQMFKLVFPTMDGKDSRHGCIIVDSFIDSKAGVMFRMELESKTFDIYRHVTNIYHHQRPEWQTTQFDFLDHDQFQFNLTMTASHITVDGLIAIDNIVVKSGDTVC